MSRYMSSRFDALEAYVPGEQPQDMKYVKLNTNESPFPPSPEVLSAVNAAETERLNLYPDPEGTALREKLAAMYGTTPENVFLANGSDELLFFAFMAFCDRERPVAFPNISYGFYPVYAHLLQVPYTEIPLREGFVLDPADYCGVGKKFRSLAGGRLGFALAAEGLIADLEKIKYSVNSYNISRLTAAAALATLDSNDYYVENSKTIQANRAYTTAELDKLGFETLPSLTNFIFTRCPVVEGGALYRGLKARGVLVRHWDKPEISDWLRVTIGTREQMDIFLDKVRELIKEAG